jgi:hypothetical protein
MTRRQKDPLRLPTDDERDWLLRVSRGWAESAARVARAKALLAVADGHSYTAAAQAAGRRSGEAVSHLVSRFNRERLAALEPRHGGGPVAIYADAERERILAEAPEAVARRGRRRYLVARDATPGSTGGSRRGGQEKLIERACTEGEGSGPAVWAEDEAGPYQTVPYPGASWQPTGDPKRRLHEYVRQGTAKRLTLFHPATGGVRARGVRRATNEVLHPWLKEEFTAILETLPPPREAPGAEQNRAEWKSWQEGLSVRITLPKELPPPRMLVVWDNLVGHVNAELLLWMFARGSWCSTRRSVAVG